MTELENFKLPGIALAIGLLIGLERGWRSRVRDEGMRVAGLRSYGLISLLGGFSGPLAQQVNAFQLGMPLKLGAFLVLIMSLSKLLKVYFGDIGTYFLAAAAGLSDVDPITLSISQMSMEVDRILGKNIGNNL